MSFKTTIQDVTEDEAKFITEVTEEVEHHMNPGGEFESDFNQMLGLQLGNVQQILSSSGGAPVSERSIAAMTIFRSFVRLGVAFGMALLLHRAREEALEEGEDDGSGEVQ